MRPRLWFMGLMCAWGCAVGHATSPMKALHDQTQTVLHHLRVATDPAPLRPGFQRFSLMAPTTAAPPTLPPALTGVLDTLNGALFHEAWSEGLLTHVPSVRTEAIQGAEVWVLPGLQVQTVVSTAITPDALLEIPRRSHLDPVLIRWFVLLHEAAHTELGEIHSPFVNPDWNPDTNQAMADLLFDPGRLGNQTFGVFDETFADIYGGLMLMRLAPDPLVAAKVIAAMHASRERERHQRIPVVLDGLFDPHAEVNGMATLVEKLDRADYRAWIQAATPEQLRQEALAQTSAVVVAWLLAHPEQFEGDFGWAKAHPDYRMILPVTEQLRLVAFRQNRALSYQLAPWADPRAAQAQTFGSPLFQAQLTHDNDWENDYKAHVSEATRAGLDAFIRGGGSAHAMDAKDFEDWAGATTQAVITPALVAQDEAWLGDRYARVARALGRPERWP